MKTMKKILCTLLVVVMCLTSAPLQGFVGIEWPEWNWKASAKSYSGECGAEGDNLMWYFDTETGALTISGKGKMYDYQYCEDTPWYNYGSDIKTINLSDELTWIGIINPFHCTFFYENISNWEDGVLYIGKHLIEAQGSLLEDAYEIKEGTKSIASYAFRFCDLTSITLPNSIINIGEGAFYNCYNLTNITIPNSVVYIGLGAFADCSNLESIVIPESVITIECGAFENCSKLKNITISSGVTEIGAGAFSHCTSLTNIIIPDSVTIIETAVFEYCVKLKTITIPNSVTKIGDSAFQYCYDLTAVYYSGTEEQWNKILIGEDYKGLSNAIIHFLGEDEPDTPDEPELDGYKFKLYSDGAYSDSIAVGESIGFDVYLLKNGKYLDCERPYAVSFDVPGVFEVNQIKNSTDSMYIKLRANKVGTTNMTISDSVTGAYVTIKLKANNPIEVLTMDEVEGLAKENEGIKTHFYDYNGLYVNNFYYREKSNGACEVSMNVYNEKAHYGAVVSYDKDGNIHKCQVIDPQDKLPESILDGIFDLFDRVNYELEVFGDKSYTNDVRTKWTRIECLEVPKDGYLVISNNAYTNDYVTFVNLVDIAIDVYFAKKGIKDLVNPEARKKAIEMTLVEIVSEIGADGFKSLFDSIFKNTVKEITIDNIDIIINNLINLLDEFNVDFEKVLKKSIDIEFWLNLGEDVALFLLGGESIKKVLQVAGYSNTALKLYDMGGSILSSEICIYTPPADEKVRKSNGVTVTSETPLDPDYVLHSYIINETDDVMSNAKPTIEALTSNYTMYDITLYKSSQAVQPTAKITVMIPIPAGYNKNNIQVYWYKADGTLQSMNAKVQGDYAVFETDHLSYYVLVEEEETQEHSHSYEVASIVNATCTETGTITYTCSCSETYTETVPATGHSFAEGQSKCSNCDYNKADSCSCRCHKSGLSKIIFKIVLIFQKIFKKNRICEGCGVYHY